MGGHGSIRIWRKPFSTSCGYESGGGPTVGNEQARRFDGIWQLFGRSDNYSSGSSLHYCTFVAVCVHAQGNLVGRKRNGRFSFVIFMETVLLFC